MYWIVSKGKYTALRLYFREHRYICASLCVLCLINKSYILEKETVPFTIIRHQVLKMWRTFISTT